MANLEALRPGRSALKPLCLAKLADCGWRGNRARTKLVPMAPQLRIEACMRTCTALTGLEDATDAGLWEASMSFRWPSRLSRGALLEPAPHSLHRIVESN
jgi:hypothetical protein